MTCSLGNVDLLRGRRGQLQVPGVCVGAVPLANRFGVVSEGGAIDLVEAAYRSGITLFDVAPL